MVIFYRLLVVLFNFHFLKCDYLVAVPPYGYSEHLRPVFRVENRPPPYISAERIQSENQPQPKVICKTAICVKYMDRLKKLTSNSGNVFNTRMGRQLQFQDISSGIYDKASQCRLLHPTIADMNFLPATHNISECKFQCFSRSHSVTFSHIEYNGAPCQDRKVCWSGTCRDRGDTLDYNRCRARFPTRPVQALVKLDCHIVCQTLDDHRLWIYEKQNSPLCVTPFWLPKKQDANAAFQ